MPPLFLVMFPGEAPESYIAPASRLYPPFGRVIFCRRRRQSLGVRARFYSDVPQRCHSVAPPHKNVPPRAALLAQDVRAAKAGGNDRREHYYIKIEAARMNKSVKNGQ